MNAVEMLRKQVNDAHKRNCNLTIYGIAKRSGVSVDSLYRFASGERDLYFANAVKVMDVLGLKIS